jgi:cardiolipin synthase
MTIPSKPMQTSEVGTRFLLLQDGVTIRRELLAIIADAAESICLVMYIFCNDESGRAVLSELIRAANRGVRVRIIIDGFGSAFTPARFFAPFLAAGGSIQRFNADWHPRYLFRNHQKFLIADSRTAITGGFNIADHYFADGVRNGWRETGVRVDGPSVSELQIYFELLWNLPIPSGLKLRDMISGVVKVRRPARNVEWLISRPGVRRSRHAEYLRRDLKRASQLSLMMGYFVPTVSLRRLIGRIARRGHVQIVLPQITDMPISRYAAWFTFPRLLRDGCQIYEYQPRPLHAKLIVMDDIVYAGSANIDLRSLHVNFELSVRIQDAKLAAEVLQLVEKDISLCTAITQEVFARNSSFFKMMIRRIAYLVLSRFDYFLSRKFVD